MEKFKLPRVGQTDSVSEVLIFKTVKELADWVQEQIKNQNYSIELLKEVSNDSDIDELKEIFIETLK